MATSNYKDVFTKEAGEDLPQYRFVTLDTDGTAILPTLGGDVYGSVATFERDGTSGTYVGVAVNGLHRAVANGSFSVGSNLAVTAAGKVKAAASGETIVARAVTASTGADQYVTVEMTSGERATVA